MNVCIVNVIRAPDNEMIAITLLRWLFIALLRGALCLSSVYMCGN